MRSDLSLYLKYPIVGLNVPSWHDFWAHGELVMAQVLKNVIIYKHVDQRSFSTHTHIILQSVPFIMSLITVFLSYGKSSSGGISRDSCRVQDYNKRGALYKRSVVLF